MSLELLLSLHLITYVKDEILIQKKAGLILVTCWKTVGNAEILTSFGLLVQETQLAELEMDITIMTVNLGMIGFCIVFRLNSSRNVAV